MSEVEVARRLLGRRRLSQPLFEHSLGVMVCAGELAERWAADPESAAAAGLVHDVCREMDGQEVLRRARKLGVAVGPLEATYPVQLLHGPLAAAESVGRGLSPDTLEAVARHTVGGCGLGVVARCVFLADAIEPRRRYAGVGDVRRLAETDLAAALLAVVERDIERLEARGREIHPAMRAFREELREQRV